MRHLFVVVAVIAVFSCKSAVSTHRFIDNKSVECVDLNSIVTHDMYNAVLHCVLQFDDDNETSDEHDCHMECVTRRLRAVTRDGFLIPKRYVDSLVPRSINKEFNDLYRYHVRKCNTYVRQNGSDNRCRRVDEVIKCTEKAVAEACADQTTEVVTSNDINEDSN